MQNYKYIFILSLFSIFSNAQETILLTKKEAIATALEHNYGVKIANNNVEVAKNNASVFNTNHLPTLSTSAGATYRNDNQDIVRQDGNETSVSGAETKSYNASVNLNYTIFDGLGRKYNYKQLKETYGLTELQARETIENTYLQVYDLYFQVAELYENTENLKEALEISKTRLTRAKYQYNYGQNTKLEVLNAEVDVNNDSISFLNSRQQYTNAKRNLNVALGVNKGVSYDVETEVEFIGLLSLEELLAKAKDNNVVLKQNASNLKINEYSIMANKSGYLPSLGFTSSYGWNKSINPSTSFLAESTNTGFNAGLNLSWNLFDSGTTKTRVANAKIALENQKIQNEQQLVIVENTLTNTWEDYNNKLFIYNAQQSNLDTAQNNFNRTHEKYKLGQVTSIEFRQSQTNLLNAQTALNVAKYDAKLKELELMQLAGEILNADF
ncbi:TolC family protein [Winogradskyella sp.]|jgi:outer membrane protein TolC|uniref:TolC family protein n=1 Tax=Winogradskyella sp. TaxID=1883156 RepID=UPI0025CC54AF|nr:TolC family protein [Winogradskyella sp.]MCT4630644.1 TolC family protein [Winogradskyella sp.]